MLAWRSRPLEPLYPVAFLDALRVKIRHDGVVKNKAVYVALASTMSGEKEVLGLWIEQTEGTKFWLSVLNELKSRGVEDILIAVVDGLKGDRGSLPADPDPDLYRAPDPQFAGGGELEGSQGDDAVAEGDLPDRDGGGGRDGAGGFRGRSLGQVLPGDCPAMAPGVGVCGAVLCRPAGDRLA